MSELLLPNKQQIKDLAKAQTALEQELLLINRLTRKQGIVVVVDGVKNQRALLAQLVKAAGFDQVLRAENGAQAIDFLYNNQVDMVVADWDAPGWGGVQILDWVRSRPSNAHLVFILAASPGQERLVAQVAEERHDLFVSKPFTLDILKNRLPGILQRRQVFALGRLQELKGFFVQARESYILALNNQPYNLWPYFNLAGLLGRNQRFAAAAACYQRVRALDRKALAAPLDEARLQEMAGNAAGAQRQYSLMIKKHPWFLKSYDALAESFLLQEKDKQALAILERAVNWGGSQNAPRLHNLARLYLKSGQKGKALPLLQKAVYLRPWENGGAKHMEIARLYADEGEMELAESHTRQGLEFSLESADTEAAFASLRLWGSLQAEQGKSEGAAQSWGLAFDPGLWPEGKLPQPPRQLAATMAKLAREAKLNSLAHHYYNLAKSLEGKGRNEWLEQRETQLALLAGQGLEFVQNGQFNEAEACYRQGLSLDPTSARLCFNLAKLQYRQGNEQQWPRYLEAARRLGPDDEELMREIKRFAQQQEAD